MTIVVLSEKDKRIFLRALNRLTISSKRRGDLKNDRDFLLDLEKLHNKINGIKTLFDIKKQF